MPKSMRPARSMWTISPSRFLWLASTPRICSTPMPTNCFLSQRNGTIRFRQVNSEISDFDYPVFGQKFLHMRMIHVLQAFRGPEVDHSPLMEEYHPVGHALHQSQVVRYHY